MSLTSYDNLWQPRWKKHCEEKHKEKNFKWSILSIEKNHIKERDINLCKAWLLYVGWPSIWDTNWGLCRTCQTSFIETNKVIVCTHLSILMKRSFNRLSQKNTIIIFSCDHFPVFCIFFPLKMIYLVSTDSSLGNTLFTVYASLKWKSGSTYRRTTTDQIFQNILNILDILRFPQMGNWLHLPTNHHQPNIIIIIQKISAPMKNITNRKYHSVWIHLGF